MELFRVQRTLSAGVSRLILFSWLIQSVQCICGSVTTGNSILWLQSNRRCLWMPTTTSTSWTSAMDYCVAQGGFLAQVYNSLDRSKILAWKATSSISGSVGHLGLYKDSAHYLQDGSQTHWKLSNSLTLPFELKDQYITFINNWGYLLDALGLLQIGSYQPFGIQSDQTMAFSNNAGYPICEQSTARMQAVYTAYPGYQSPAIVWLTVASQATRRNCARYCAKLQYCMGYNAIIVSSTSVTCQYIAEKLMDTGASLIANATSVYYELNVV